jgi:hypothetical protein
VIWQGGVAFYCHVPKKLIEISAPTTLLQELPGMPCSLHERGLDHRRALQASQLAQHRTERDFIKLKMGNDSFLEVKTE